MSRISELQQAIRVHSQDLQEELAELNRWEDEMARRNRGGDPSVDIFRNAAPIRGTPQNERPAHSPAQVANAADVAKEQGNEHFRKGNFTEAIRLYTKGIESSQVGPTAHVLYANRAMCYLKLDQWHDAEADCTRALDLDRTYAKAYFRRAQARKHLGLLREARKDLEAVLAFNSNDPATTSELKSVTLLLREKDRQNETRPKKKLVIEEVDDESDSAPPLTASQNVTPEPPPDTNIPQNDAPTKSNTDKKTLRLNSRVEELEDDEPCESRGAQPSKLPDASSPPARAKQVQPLISQPPKERAARAIHLSAPKSFAEFELTHAEVQGDPKLVDKFFSLIQPASMNSLFGVSLTSDIFCEFMHYALRQPSEIAFHTLKGLSDVGRISELTMFLSDEESLLVRKTIQHASACGQDMKHIRMSLQ